jgi:adenylosuccinate synthase
VVGLQYGDEGKGQLVDLLAGQHQFVVRFNGGANAGHSVRIGEEKFALHLLPSGILSPQTVNVIGNGVVVDPGTLLEEIDGLAARGVEVRDNLRISDRAQVVFPYHKVEDGLMEAAVAAAQGDYAAVGTTRRGIGPAYADKAHRTLGIRVGELLEPELLRTRLQMIVTLKNAVLATLAELAGETFEPFDAAAVTAQYLAYGERLRPFICDATALLHEAFEAGRPMLFEGANAAMIDLDHGTYPYCTSSNASGLGLFPGTGLPGCCVGHVYGVVKAYTSRVGAGPMPTELADATGDRIRETGGEYGTTTGRPRRCGWLDLVAVRYAARVAGATALTITGLSVLSGMPNLKVCVGYRHEGRVLDTVPALASTLDAVEPVYEELDGWLESVDECRSFADLPATAKAYLARIERHVAPVRYVCVGRRRDQVLER